MLAADGSGTNVKWLGTQQIDARPPHPTKINPISITAGAPGYGTTTYQVEKVPMDRFIYFTSQPAPRRQRRLRKWTSPGSARHAWYPNISARHYSRLSLQNNAFLRL
ncbi:hypothetical protein PEL8287_03807 [Roseovarius litorisediminis]|uniref:Uncharacterized protein n=1 Tax=Roseovarius litorisediminis TaxID=1312363 RepID=A0A1Y5TNS5_9RHOB|nr:hypothetical protein [Roseovarius litorisediminis]SLN68478.1 hypothetical protein PEL8287_03807 [Roseovarius litorisediminis]